MLERCYFPQCRKTAVVVPLPKPDQDPNLPQNYRPISLLSSLSKVYESVLLKRLNQFLDNNNIIISEQFGFRKNLSTSHQLLRVTELIFDGFAKSETTGALFLDVAKAFDKIWHDGLLATLMRLSCSVQFIKMTHSFLTSPVFNIYVNDIPNLPRSHLPFFADDTAILTKHKHPDIAVQALQTYVSQLQIWLTNWKIKVNPSKCACLLFTKKRNMPVLNPIQIFGQPVPFVSEYKYLGSILEEKLNFDSHIQRVVTKAKNSSFALGRLIAPKSTLATKHKLLLYKTIVRPVMLYGSPLWGTASIRNLRKLQFFQNQQLARIVNAPWYVKRKLIHQDLKIDPVLDFMKIISKKFFEKLPRFPTHCCNFYLTTQPFLFFARDLERCWIIHMRTSRQLKDVGMSTQWLRVWTRNFIRNSYVLALFNLLRCATPAFFRELQILN
ncbi:RNA-directed DNA polymerase from mobile element jockey [Araneus ventricosus]|uniref:RNA-directed DNA polymerase from mobile element jockey n=1 Tax=Araneus ventricosus TaxID=182803 RepID=A0A4Y2V867_ARAVE|nr:RNA-directed DNA polymerase from mobile element jockey [Araneus ventricosus]